MTVAITASPTTIAGTQTCAFTITISNTTQTRGTLVFQHRGFRPISVSGTATYESVNLNNGEPVKYFRNINILTTSTTVVIVCRAYNPSGWTGAFNCDAVLRFGSTVQHDDVTVNIVRGTNTTVPAAPSAPVLVQTSRRILTASWTDNSTNEDYFLVSLIENGVGGTEIVVQAGATSYQIDRTQYPWNYGSTLSFSVRAANDYGTSASVTSATITAGAAPAAPAAPTTVTAAATGPTTATVTWTDNKTDLDYYDVSIINDTTFVVAFQATVPFPGAAAAYTLTQDVSGLEPNNSYTAYVTPWFIGVQGTAGDATFDTPTQAPTLAEVSGFTLTPFDAEGTPARISTIQVGGALMVFSDLDRAKIYSSRKWFEAGLKPQLVAPTVAAGSADGLTGRFRVYICLYRSSNPACRSLPSPASDEIELDNEKLVITPEADGLTVSCRDIGYNVDGSLIQGADYWEAYVHEENSDQAYMVCRLPMTTLSFTTSASLDLLALKDGTHRPMEQAYQCTLPPACAYVAYYNNRIVAFGERTIRGQGSLSLTDASRTITISGVDQNGDPAQFTDALYWKELFLNKVASGWFIEDVIDANTATIVNPDPDLNTQGWQGGTQSYSDFRFAGRASRVYTSGYYTGEALGGVTFNPQGFPPETVFESEFDPDDNEDPNGAIASQDTLYLMKPSKVFLVTGGTEPDFPQYQVRVISRNSGLLAPQTLSADRNDEIHYLSDQGVHKVTESGVTKLNDITGNAWMFQKYYDLATAEGAVGVWFPREDYHVVANIGRLNGASPGYGFIYDSRNRYIWPFTLVRPHTAYVTYKNDEGQPVLIYGAANGIVGEFLLPDLYVDEVDFLVADPYASESPQTVFMKSGIVPCSHSRTPTRFCPRFKMSPNNTAVEFTIETDGKARMTNPDSFVANATRTFSSTSTGDYYRMASLRRPSVVYKVSWVPSRHERVTMNGIEFEAWDFGTS